MKETDDNRMPDAYFSIDEYIVYTQPFNFNVAKIGTVQTGKTKGRQRPIDITHHSSIKEAYKNVLRRIQHESFPDFEKIFTKMDAIENKIDELLNFKYTI